MTVKQLYTRRAIFDLFHPLTEQPGFLWLGTGLCVYIKYTENFWLKERHVYRWDQATADQISLRQPIQFKIPQMYLVFRGTVSCGCNVQGVLRFLSGR